MRRIILSGAIVVTVAVIVTGVAWYVHRNSGARLLARASLAMQAGEYERVVKLSRAYAVDNPGDWRPHYYEARAQIALGRYDKARKALDAAAQADPDRIETALARADTFSRPALRKLRTVNLDRDARLDRNLSPQTIRDAIEQLEKAREILEAITPADENAGVEKAEALGLIEMHLGRANQALAKRFGEDAEIARQAGNAALEEHNQDLAAQARREADQHLRKATDRLLEVARYVAKTNPDQAATHYAQPMDALVQVVCMARGDPRAIQEVKAAIDAMADPPPLAVAKLVLNQLGLLKAGDEGEPTTGELQNACNRLDALLQKHPDAPDAIRIRLYRANLALRQGDLDKAEAIANAILQTLPQHAGARLLKAQVAYQRGDKIQAEKDLFTLKTDKPDWADAQYLYAVVARESKPELAREALRTIIKDINPDHFGARQLLTGTLMDGGFDQDALEEAQDLLKTILDKAREKGKYPRATAQAISLLAECARRTGERQLALDTLDALRAPAPPTAPHARPLPPPTLTMRSAIADAYLRFGATTKAKAELDALAEITANSLDAYLAKGKALLSLGRYAEAENLLNEAKQTYDVASVHRGLGELFLKSGRALQAIEELREVLRRNHNDRQARLLLATALLRVNLFDEAQHEVDRVLSQDPNNADALFLADQIHIIKGEPAELETVADTRLAGERGLSLARTLLSRGEPQRCIDLCKETLQQEPDNAAAHWLLGQAHLVLGQTDPGIAQWKAAIRAAPNTLAYYQALASLLSRDKPTDAVRADLATVAGSNPDLVNLAVGRMLASQRRYEEAAEYYDRVASRPGADDALRNQARFWRAEALDLAGDPDRASFELGTLAKEPGWRSRALVYHAKILARTGQRDKANAVLENVAAAAWGNPDKPDWNALAGVTTAYIATRQPEKALDLIEKTTKRLPAQPHLLLQQADVLRLLGRTDEALGCLRRAVACQPGDFRLHVRLARALDSAGKPDEALAVLQALEAYGQAGRTVALLERAQTFNRWGLQAQAVATLHTLIQSDPVETPRVHMILGRALQSLGETDGARKQFQAISPYASDYLEAQLRLAQLAGTVEEKLDVLREAEQKKASPVLRAERIRALTQAQRPADAVALYRDYQKTRAEGTLPPAPVLDAGFRAMLEADDLPAAADLAADVADRTKSDVWRLEAILLNMDANPDAARARLRDADSCAPIEVLLGLCLFQDSPDRLAVWTRRLEEFPAQAAAMQPPRTIPGEYLVLGHVVAGQLDKAEQCLKSDQPQERRGCLPGTMEELIASARTNPAVRNEAVTLTKALAAWTFGELFRPRNDALRNLGRRWAYQALENRNESQWAARLASQDLADMAWNRKVRALLKPDDCAMAVALDLYLLLADGKNQEAADLAKTLAETHWNHADLLKIQADATERAGHPDEAARLYQQAWETWHDPIAGNNAADLIARLHPNDPTRLKQAQEWMDAILQAQPDSNAYRDTAGWIAYLLGENEKALAELRTAVKAFPNAPTVHYHLGMAERKAGNVAFARWHLQAAVDLGKAAKATDQSPGTVGDDAVERAQAALAELQEAATP